MYATHKKKEKEKRKEDECMAVLCTRNREYDVCG